MITSSYINQFIFPKPAHKQISFIKIEQEKKTKRIIGLKYKGKYPQINISTLILKRTPELNKKYNKILLGTFGKIDAVSTTTIVSKQQTAFQFESSSWSETVSHINVPTVEEPKGSQLFSPIFSPLFPSPKVSNLIDLLNESQESSSHSDTLSDIEDYSISRRNLSEIEPENFIPSQILPTYSIEQMSCLSLRDQRFIISTTEEWAMFDKLRSGNNFSTLILEKYDIPITVAKYNCLREGAWLNDEIINFYFKMLQAYDMKKQQNVGGYRKSHFFNSFHMTRLLDTYNEYRFESVARWVKKFSHILDYEKIFFPININSTHWSLGVVYIQLKKVVYYCSMHCKGGKYLKGLKSWLQDTYLQFGIDSEDWTLWTFVEDGRCPRQSDGFSCGVFVCMFADFLVDNLALNFTATDAKVFFRSKIGLDILRGELSYCFTV